MTDITFEINKLTRHHTWYVDTMKSKDASDIRTYLDQEDSSVRHLCDSLEAEVGPSLCNSCLDKWHELPEPVAFWCWSQVVIHKSFVLTSSPSESLAKVFLQAVNTASEIVALTKYD